MAQRVEDVLKIRLLGGDFDDIREYAKGDESEGRKPWAVSDSQLWRYVAASDELLQERSESDRNKLIRRHLAQRSRIYARAMEAGDLRAAIAALKDEAELQGLYPATKHEHGGTIKHAGRIDMDHTIEALTDEQLARIAAGADHAAASRGGTAAPP